MVIIMIKMIIVVPLPAREDDHCFDGDNDYGGDNDDDERDGNHDNDDDNDHDKDNHWPSRTRFSCHHDVLIVVSSQSPITN